MKAEVKILIEGFTNADSVAEAGEEKTWPTISLVRDGDLTIVVDPGSLKSQQLLIDALAEEGLTVNDIDIVCITHSHIDHYRNIGMFPEAKTLEFYGLWDKDTVADWSERFTTNIQVLRTPGHDYTGITLFADTNNGVVAICGDVFWKENYPQEPQYDAFASDTKKLLESRKIVLRTADWVIPGHGGIFSARKEKAELASSEARKEKKKKTNIVVTCRKCGRVMEAEESCTCRPWLCFRHCECGFDCEFCGCSHKR